VKLWFERALLPNGWAEKVLVEIGADGSIASVSAGAEEAAADERHGVAMPGLPNVHSHGFQRGMAGLAERRRRADDDFWGWRDVMYHFLDRLTPDDIAAITAQAYVEMLESGYTHVGEFHYLHNDRDGRPYADRAETAGAIAAAADQSGIGLTLLPVFYAHSDFGGAAPNQAQRRLLSDVDGFARLVEASRAKLPSDAVCGIAPHSLRAITPEELRAILPLAGDHPIHIHIAEQVREVEACLAWSNRRPVEWLLSEVGVDDRWCLVHATHLVDAECDALAASGAVVGLCPITEANLGDGIFPAIRYMTAGGRWATGSDSNVLVDAAGEFQMLEYSQRLAHRQRTLLARDDCPSVGEALIQDSLRGGAKALGRPFGLAVGASADIVTFDSGHPAFAGNAPMAILDRWMFAGGPIQSVWRGGKLRVSHGRHLAAEAIAVNYRATLNRLTT